MDSFNRGIWGSLAAGVLIVFVLLTVGFYELTHPAALVGMSTLVAIAVYVYFNFREALGEKWFNRLGPPIISLAAVGVILLWLGRAEGAVAIAVAYFGEPAMGYYIYKKLKNYSAPWALAFLTSAVVYAYTLPLTMWSLWTIPLTADVVKVITLTYFAVR